MPMLKKIHKWLSLLVGLQLLIWIGSGLFFNLMDHDKSSGNQYRQRIDNDVKIDATRLLEPKVILNNVSGVISIKQQVVLNQPVYLLTHKKSLYRHFVNQYSLLDAYTGELIVIDQTKANAIALSSYSGFAQIRSTVKLLPPIDDISREKNMVWQINFADDLNTSIYVNAESGRLVAHSNDDKRFADFFFMLHFMDYAGEGSFNNIQIIIFAIFTLFLALTGFIWTVELARNGQYKFNFINNVKRTQQVKLFDKNKQLMKKVDLSHSNNLLDALIEHDIALPSICGGGGSCGSCRIQVSSKVAISSADHHHFTDNELKQGFRLACQHSCEGLTELTLPDVIEAKKHTIELTESRFISPFIKELRFKIVSGKAFSFKAGAFVRFVIPAAKGCSIPLNLPDEFKPHWHHIEQLDYEHLACTRSYSLAESSLTTSELVFTIKIQTAPEQTILPGVASSYLCNLAVGNKVDVIGPFEEFFATPHTNKTMVLLGAGSGMAPLKSLIDEQLSLNRNRELHFFYGARMEGDLLYRNEFEQLAKSHENFHYYPTLSQANENWQGARGYAQQVLANQFESLAMSEFYLCGPQALMNETIELLKSYNVDSSSIFFDTFNS